jgi:monofunctional biosynthetic peptidoglycan transglycosylase
LSIHAANDPVNIRLPEAESGPAVEHRSPVRRVARRAGRAALVIAAAYYALCIALLVVYRFVSPPITGVQLERHIGALLSRHEYDAEKRFVPYDRIPQHVARAVLAAEDGRFWNHWGFDIKEMRAAGAEVLEGEIPRGASTITQQLMKNLFGTTSRNPVRKLYDMALTPAAEIILGKRRILELYLNNAEWGPGIFGIEAGARHHYGTSVRGLSRAQAAGLAALLPNPRQRTPESTSEYRSQILRRMASRGW